MSAFQQGAGHRCADIYTLLRISRLKFLKHVFLQLLQLHSCRPQNRTPKLNSWIGGSLYLWLMAHLSGERLGTLAELFQLVQRLKMVECLPELRRLNISTSRDLWSLCASDRVCAARLENQDPHRLSLTDSDGRARPDHWVIDFSAGGSQSIALAAIVSEAGRERVLNRADARVVTRGTAASQLALWRTWCFFSRAWGLQPIPLTVDGVRKILPTFSANHKTPEQYVSEARRRHTLAHGEAPPADVEIMIKKYVA